MSESPTPPSSPLFTDPVPSRSFPTTAVAIAAVAVFILIAALVVLERREERIG